MIAEVVIWHVIRWKRGRRLVADMSEHFLEEQLKRIRHMTEQMTRLQNRAAELSDAFERDRIAGRHDPLHEIRDFRTHSSFEHEADRADDHARRQQPRTPRSRRR